MPHGTHLTAIPWHQNRSHTMTHLDTCAQKGQNKILMEVKLAVLADYASVTREGKLNILGIFDIINPSSFPFALPMFCVVVSYEAGAAEFNTLKQTQIVLCDEDGNSLLSLPQKVRVVRPDRSGTKSTINQIAGVSGFPFQKAGDYQFCVTVNGEQKTSISLRVNEPRPKEK